MNQELTAKKFDQLFQKAVDEVLENPTRLTNAIKDELWEETYKEVEDKNSDLYTKNCSETKNFVWPHSDGTCWAGWASFYDYVEQVLGIELPEIWHVWKEQTNFSVMWCLEDFCIMSQKPIFIGMKDDVLHADGKAAIEYADGFCCYALNGIKVPEWLAKNPSGSIDPAKIKEIDNVEVRREFVRKVGLERIYHSLGGKIIDQEVVEMESPQDKNWECHYKLVELNFGSETQPTFRRVLQMPNASLDEIWHVEYVPTECETVKEAMNFRLNRFEENVDDEDGEEWYLHGDVIIKPKGAKKTKRWPSKIA